MCIKVLSNQKFSNINLFLLLIFLTFILTGCIKDNDKSDPVIKSATLDLQDWDFKVDGTVELKGEWGYFKNKFIEPSNQIIINDFKNLNLSTASYPKDLIKLNTIATYKLIVNANDSNLAFIIDDAINSEYKIWVNNRLLYEKTNPYFYGKRMVEINESSNRLDITYQVKGFASKIYLGNKEILQTKNDTQNSLELLCIGSLLFMGLYHVTLFIFRKKNKEVLFFALFCFSMLFTMLISNYPSNLYNIGVNRLVTFILNIVGYSFFSLLLPLTTCFIHISIYFFLKYLFNDPFSKLVSIFFKFSVLIRFIIIVINIFLIPFLNDYRIILFSEKIILISELPDFIIDLVFLFACIRILRSKQLNSRIVTIGGIILPATGIYEVIAQSNTDTPKLFFFSVTLFMFMQSVAIARNFSSSFRKVEILSERLSKLDKLKDEFLANTSHELRTPVNGIIGISESLIDGVAGKLHSKVIENLEMIVSSGKRLGSLINDLLDFSRLKNKDIILQSKNTDIKQIVEIVSNIIKSTQLDKKIDVINAISDDIAFVKGDENRIQQIMYNLIGNSYKFTKEGYIKISAEEKEDFIVICVEDTGIGIPKNKLQDIFKSFEQVDSSISREYGGTGLGLSITKQLVELHGGEIWVESELDKGSKFYFTLPRSADEKLLDNSEKFSPVEIFKIDQDDQLLIDSEAYISDDQKKLNSNVRILVVDDEKINIQVLANHLFLQHYLVDIASNGVEALCKISKNNYDLILLDVMMPKMSGYEVCKKIREVSSIYDMPVIMLTAKNHPQDIVVGFDVGANDYITKPFEKNELLARVKTMLSLKSAVKTAIENAKMFGEAKSLANMDGLTGLNNRRHLFELAKIEWDNSRSKQKSLSVLMMDIDNFKKFNDVYGHDIGDKILKLVAETIFKAVRGIDIVGRYGGEEFAVILPDTQIVAARLTAERIRKAVESQCLSVDKFDDLKCSVSIGVASLDDNATELEQLFKNADNMLYKAKESGRNRVKG